MSIPVGELELVADPHAARLWTAFDTSADESAAIQARALGAITWRRLRNNTLR
jgi:hypothetical protein